MENLVEVTFLFGAKIVLAYFLPVPACDAVRLVGTTPKDFGKSLLFAAPLFCFLFVVSPAAVIVVVGYGIVVVWRDLGRLTPSARVLEYRTCSSVRYRTGNYNCSSKPSLFDFFFDFFGGTI